jgi:membrane protease YdiL (CAAX protease family)
MLLYAVGTLIWLVVLGRLVLHRRDPLREVPSRPNRLSWGALLWVILVYCLASILGSGGTAALLPGHTDELLAGQLSSACANAVAFVVTAGACAWLAGMAFEARVRGFGLTTCRLGRDLVWAVLVALATWPLVAALLWLSEWAVVLTAGEEYLRDHRVIDSLQNPALPFWGRLLLVVTAVVLAPLAEEFFFRGLVQTKLASALRSRWAAIALAGVFFGLVHGDQLAAIAPLAVMGMILGFVYEYTGSLIGPILVHAVFNAKSLFWHFLLNAQ